MSLGKLLWAGIAVPLLLCTIHQAAAGVVVYPLRVEYASSTPKLVTPITLRNESNERIRIRVSIEDWYLKEDGTPVFVRSGKQAEPRRWSARDWIRTSPVEFELDAQAEQLVRWSIRPPRSAESGRLIPEPGGYRAAIVFTLLPPLVFGDAPPPPSFESRIATVVYYTVGDPQPQGKLTGIEVETAQDSLATFISLHNPGNVHYRLKGRVQVYSNGEEIISTPVPDIPVLPGGNRRFKVDLKQALAPGEYALIAALDIGREELFVGKKRFTVPREEL